jgi:hypothetical protein
MIAAWKRALVDSATDVFDKALDLELMKLIDKQYMRTPSWGSRSIKNQLPRLGSK